MVDNPNVEPDWGEELKELKSRMNETVEIMTDHFKIKGQEKGTNALMTASVPLFTMGPFIDGPRTMTEPLYGMPLNMMPMSFPIAHELGSSTSIPFPDPTIESLRVIIPPPPNMVVNEAAAFNPNVTRPSTTMPFLCQSTFAPNHGESFNVDEGLSEQIKEQEKVKMMEKKQLIMEEKLKLIQGTRVYGPTGIEEFLFTPHLDISKDFKCLTSISIMGLPILGSI
ncbi:hypothetical protein L6164_037437 [Bauhinia variegata]|uniref:Uncharacterized protein n=1 Tax=Bauhinia variegata TaxID=167791 RepID=A0ACB9KKU3_BAUVA|nr:hypothetical protein L6164_037437 [Bauhinia variegata]